MSVIEQCVHRDPADPRLLRLDDGRPVLAVIGGGHDEPFTRLQLQLIAERVERAWNGAAADSQARAERIAQAGEQAMRTVLQERLKERGRALVCHPVANGSIDCTEAAGELLVEAGATLERQQRAIDGYERLYGEAMAALSVTVDERDKLRAALQHERDCIEAAKAEIARLQARLGEAVDQARTLEESYDTAVARLALAKDHMHPDQRVAFNALHNRATPERGNHE